MLFALGIFLLTLASIIDTKADDWLHFHPRWAKSLEFAVGVALTMVVLSLMHFGVVNML